jgi:pilus assembly protein FimV
MTRPKALVFAVCLALTPLSGDVLAAGLGRLTVQSALGQPLRAEVEVTSLTREEAQSLSARLASSDAFRQAGLEFNQALSSVRFDIETRGTRTFIKLSTQQPIADPFVDLLLELNWATGKLLREYTFLLDPPDLRDSRARAEASAGRPATVVPPVAAPAQVPGPAPAVSAPAAAVSAPVSVSGSGNGLAAGSASGALAAPAGSSGASENGVDRTGAVTVRSGDTLGRIAGTVRPAGVSLEQAMVALYRANPSAFLGNMNLVREGARLAVPSRADMAALPAAEATRELRMQSADFAAMRRRLAEGAAQLDAPRSGQSASGALSGQVDDAAAAAAAGDRLKLSKPAATASGSTGSMGAPAANTPAEQRIAGEAALKESSARVLELERNIEDLRKALELRNRNMSELQRKLDEALAAQRAINGKVGGTVGAEPATAVPSAVVPAASGTAASGTAADGAAPAAEASSGAKGATPDQAARPASDATTPSATPKPMPDAVPAAGARAQAPGLLQELLDDPMLLAGIGGVAALGLGYAVYSMRRRRKVEGFEDSLVPAEPFASNSLFGSTGGQTVDTSQASFAGQTEFTEPHATEVDPIAEADVYIAYGRESQAEDILREALLQHPERQPIRYKLLQIYAARNDLDAFEHVAREVNQMTAGKGEDWEKTAALGLSIDPFNPLYGGPGGARSAPVASGAPDDTMFVHTTGATAASALALASSQAPALDRDTLARLEPADTDLFDFPDLDLDSELPPASLERDVGAPGAGLRPLPDLDLDLPTLSEAVSPREALSATPLDSDTLIDLELDLPALETLTRSGAQSVETGVDLSPINLDLEHVAVELEESVLASGGSPRWQEMSTKLDLASAYEEIGDKEGARELLREVIVGGDSRQQQTARSMLGKIG